MKKIGLKLVLILSLISLATACGNPNDTATKSPSQQSGEQSTDMSKKDDPTNVAAVDEKKAAELLAQFGGKTPEKVVTVSVSITEIMNELGVQPVGVPTSSIKLPDAMNQVARIGPPHSPNLEQIAKLQPDAVIGPVSIKDRIDNQLKSASLPGVYLPVDSLEDLKLSTVVLGRLFKQEDKANALLQKVTKEEQEILDQVKGKTGPKVLFLFGSTESLMFMNDNTFAGSLAKKLGATNVASDVFKQKEPYSPLNMESIVAANPDVILLVAHGDPAAAAKKFEEDVKKNGAWEKLNAFKNGKMKTLDYSVFGTASIVKAPEAYEQLAKIFYE